MWGEERARAMLADAGFGEVSVQTLPHDIQNSFYVVTRPCDRPARHALAEEEDRDGAGPAPSAVPASAARCSR